MMSKIKESKRVTVTENVEKFMGMAKTTGAFTEHQAKQILNDSEYEQMKRLGMFNTSTVRVKRATLKDLYASKAISKEIFERETKAQIPSISISTCSQKGRRFADKALGIKDMHSSNSKVHDVKLTCKYLTLTDEEKASAKSEAEIRKELRSAIENMKKNDNERYEALKSKYEERLEGFTKRFEDELEKGSPADFAYIESGSTTYTGYEVVTRHYKEYDIQLKQFSMEIMGYGYQEARI